VQHFADSIQQLKQESQDILDIPKTLFVPWEWHLLKLIKYMITTGETSVIKCDGDAKINKWIQTQRLKRNRYERDQGSLGKVGEEGLKEDIVILDRIGFAWKGRDTKTFDDYYDDLRAYKEEHGNVKVSKLLQGSNLGEWVSKMRREYDDLLEGKKVVTLNQERIEALNELGMIWKIRHGRPRKGDARFRLRRKGDTDKEDENDGHVTVAQDIHAEATGDSAVIQQDMSFEDSESDQKHGGTVTCAAAASTATEGPGDKETDLDHKISATTWL